MSNLITTGVDIKKLMTKDVYDPDDDGVIAVAQTEADMKKSIYDIDDDGIVDDIILHGADKHTNRTRKIFIPPIYTDGTRTTRTTAHTVCDIASNQSVYAELKLPEDFVSLVSIKIVLSLSSLGGTVSNQYFYADYGADGEAPNTYSETSTTTSLTLSGNDVIDIKDTGLTLTGVTKDDIIGLRYQNSYGVTIHVFGFIIEYEADM